MGRKIPAKKHRGVKDPEKQRAKRLAELETRTNAPPKDANEQPIPKSLERVIRLKEAAKSGGIIKKKRKKRKNALICVGSENPLRLHPKARPDKVVPIFQQNPGESAENFLHRVSRETNAFLKETAFEKKYNVQVQRNPKTGIIEGLTKCKLEKDDVEMLRAKHRNIKKKKKVKAGEERTPSLTKGEKRKEKLRLRKEKKLQDNSDDFESFQDTVAFGEVAHEPPRLKMNLKGMDEQRKPKNLLLHSLFEGDKKVSCDTKIIDRRGKRKNLPAAERRCLEKQQSEVIAAYRQLKLQRSGDAEC